MAEITQKFSLHTQIAVDFYGNGDAVPVDIIATSVDELKQTVAALLDQPAPAAQAAAPAPAGNPFDFF